MSELETIQAQLQQLQEMVEQQTIATKNVLTFDEAVRFTGYSQAYLYTLTSKKKIPYHKPLGKHIFFQRDELERWLLSHRIATNEEVATAAANYCLTHETRGGGNE